MIQLQNNSKTDAAWNQLYDRLETDGLLSETKNRKVEKLFRLAYLKWAAAIALICISVTTLIFTTNQNKADKDNLLTLQNKKGAVTLVTTLEDGSIVYLADDAQLNYPSHFEENIREVFLSGNALFEISGNKERPFLIDTKEVRVEVLGTSFYIKDDTNTTFELAVKHGKVKVIHKEKGSEKIVEAGQTVRLLSDKLSVTPTENENLFNLYTQKIQFKDEPLGNILHVVNKKLNSTKLQTTPELSKRPLTVTFSNNSPEKVAQLICLALDLTYEEKNEVILISEMN